MHKHTGLVPCQETKSPPEGLRKKNGVWGGEVEGENFEKRDVLVTKPLSLITGSWVIGLSLGIEITQLTAIFLNVIHKENHRTTQNGLVKHNTGIVRHKQIADNVQVVDISVVGYIE